MAALLASAAPAALDKLNQLADFEIPVNKKFKFLFEPIVLFAKWILRSIARFVRALPQFIITTRLLMASAIFIGIMMSLMLIVIIILYYVHPRLLLLNRYANLDQFRDRMIADVQRCMDVLVVRRLPASSMLTDHAKRLSALRDVYGLPLTTNDNFANELEIYLRYKDTLERLRDGNFIYKKIGEASFKAGNVFLKENDPTMIDYDQIEEYMDRFAVPWNRFCKVVREATTAVAADVKLMTRSGEDAAVHMYLSALFEIDIVVNEYTPVALDSFSLRKGSEGKNKINFVIFERYYAPFVKDMWTSGIMNTLRACKDLFLSIFLMGDMLWSKVGEFIGKMPCLGVRDEKIRKKCTSIRFGLKIGMLQSEYDSADIQNKADNIKEPKSVTKGIPKEKTNMTSKDWSSNSSAKWDKWQSQRQEAKSGEDVRAKSEDFKESFRPCVRPDVRAAMQNKAFQVLLTLATLGVYRRKPLRTRRSGSVDSGKNVDKSFEHYVGDDDDDYVDDDEDAVVDEDTVEHFASLFAMARTIGTFFKNFLPLGMQLVKYGKDMLTSPFDSFFGILTLILSPIIGFFMLIYYSIFSLPLILGCSPVWYMSYVVAITVTVVYFFGSLITRVLLMIIMLFIMCILWFIDMMTGGFIIKLMQCEDDPDAPEIRKNYIYGNGYKRGVLGCLYPCFAGFQPRPLYFLGNTPYLCRRQERSCPSMCPQQQLLRYFRGRRLVKPYAYDMYKPGMTFRFRPLQDKVMLVRAAYKRRAEFLDTCSRNLQDRFGHISKHVCCNLNNYEFADDDEKDGAKLLCRQMFCEGPDKDEAVCGYLNREFPTTDVSRRLGEEPMKLMSRAFLVAIGGIVVFVIVLALLRASKTRFESNPTFQSSNAAAANA